MSCVGCIKKKRDEDQCLRLSLESHDLIAEFDFFTDDWFCAYRNVHTGHSQIQKAKLSFVLSLEIGCYCKFPSARSIGCVSTERKKKRKNWRRNGKPKIFLNRDALHPKPNKLAKRVGWMWCVALRSNLCLTFVSLLWNTCVTVCECCHFFFERCGFSSCDPRVSAFAAAVS